MPIKRYNGTSWDVVAGDGSQGAAGATGTSALTTKGDILTYDTAPNRLGIGSNNQVLTADSTAALGVKWATPTDTTKVPLSTVTAAGDLIVATGSGAVTNLAAGTSGYALTANGAGAAPTYQAIPTGSMTLISSASPGSVATYTFSSIPNTYKNLYLIGVGIKFSTTHQIYLRAQGITGGSSYYYTKAGTSTSWSPTADLGYAISSGTIVNTQTHNFQVTIYDYANSTVNDKLIYSLETNYQISSGFNSLSVGFGAVTGSSVNAGVGAIDNITIQDLQNNGNFTAGTLYLYGVK